MASTRAAPSKPSRSITFSAHLPLIRGSKMARKQSLYIRTQLRMRPGKFRFPAPLQFQTKQFMIIKSKGERIQSMMSRSNHIFRFYVHMLDSCIPSSHHRIRATSDRGLHQEHTASIICRTPRMPMSHIHSLSCRSGLVAFSQRGCLIGCLNRNMDGVVWRVLGDDFLPLSSILQARGERNRGRNMELVVVVPPFLWFSRCSVKVRSIPFLPAD